ncbi:DUF4291 domain-containing protein [Planomonospora sp. ID82291]|uniref:DUF4291 domain-containing protein n=1 Tax=Planomonospora sp. ID82291 TaxID=2738136 RepID=UPI0018C3BBEE|nr:DUF4291 domain-containing protein [Planomonospora sp. ID82291]MBG0818518.1 DUF4291 domain-containing protein [Planomonospora sp. ID82291]
MSPPYRQIRAVYTDDSVTVYQAYDPLIADPAVAAQRFVPPFKRERMTWIKPSFLWMMYRCGWAAKPGQSRILAVEITREGFEWALARSCPSHPGRDADDAGREAWARRLRRSPVRVQWDPERDPHLNALPYRSIQIGLSGEAVRRYVEDWTVSITDVTDRARDVHAAVRARDVHAAVRARDVHAAVRARGQVAGLLPAERPYPLPPDLARVVGATVDDTGRAPAPAVPDGAGRTRVSPDGTAGPHGEHGP